MIGLLTTGEAVASRYVPPPTHSTSISSTQPPIKYSSSFELPCPPLLTHLPTAGSSRNKTTLLPAPPALRPLPARTKRGEEWEEEEEEEEEEVEDVCSAGLPPRPAR